MSKVTEETYKITAIYARQSLDKKDSLSIEGQIDECKHIVKGDNIEIYSDKGYSGKNTERPDIKRLITDIELDKVDTVIVYKLDRISRNITDFYKLYEIMDKHNCKFCSASENFETSSPMGKAMMGILAIFAQMERENIQKRVKDNYYFRTANSGSWAGGPAPYGYKNGRNEHNKPTLIPIEEEIETVKRIFSLYKGLGHFTLGHIAKVLNRDGLKPHKREVFDSVTVSRILQNSIYVKADKTLYAYFKTRKINFLNDKEDWDGTRTAHIIGKKVGNVNVRSYTTMENQSVYLTNFSGFIPSYQYIEVQNTLKENKQFARNNTMGFLEELGGMLKCSKCGYAIKSYSQSTNGRPYIDCYGNRSLHVCKEKYNKVNFFELQEKVGAEIQKVLDNFQSVHDKSIKEFCSLAFKIDDLIKKRDKLVNSIGDNETLNKAILPSIEKIQKNIDELELKRRTLQHSASIMELSLEQNVWLRDTLAKGLKYEDLNINEKREVVRTLIERIELTPDIDTFTIKWKI